MQDGVQATVRIVCDIAVVSAACNGVVDGGGIDRQHRGDTELLPFHRRQPSNRPRCGQGRALSFRFGGRAGKRSARWLTGPSRSTGVLQGECFRSVRETFEGIGAAIVVQPLGDTVKVQPIQYA